MQYDPNKEQQLIVIDKSEVRAVWHLVEPALIALRTEQEAPDKWIVPDVYNSITSGGATLAFTTLAPAPDRTAAINSASGFVVLQKVNGYAGSALHIWIAARTDKDSTGKAEASIMRTFSDDLDALARHYHCNAITFGSNRAFWDKVAPRFGFEVLETRWSRPVV
ncbi:hypothetical protein [Burkholderia guangdongensis]|uniref:hypothetical protein n=1 Tax=Burkholderia guangdongensis TaxID=1792500 RepID=UPI0015C99D5F|nr:hypothetical protein [Burkholderia guangdongensis]